MIQYFDQNLTFTSDQNSLQEVYKNLDIIYS